MLNIASMSDILFRQSQILHQGFEFPISYFIRPGSAQTLLFLHGLGASKHEFLGAVGYDGLRDYRLVAFDFPGCGETPYPADQVWALEDLVQLTDQLTAALDLTEFVIAGHSLGGLAGLIYSHQHPGKVRAFVDIEGNLGPEDCFLTRAVARLSFPDFLGTRHLENLKVKFGNARDTGMRMWADALGRQTSPRAFYDYSVSAVAWSDNADLLATFMGLPVPRLFIYGSANNHLSYLPRLRLSDTAVVEVPRGAHWPHLDNPEYFYRAVALFLAGR